MSTIRTMSLTLGQLLEWLGMIWRVVMIPDDIKQSLAVLGFIQGISSHSFDDMEPFVSMHG